MYIKYLHYGPYLSRVKCDTHSFSMSSNSFRIHLCYPFLLLARLEPISHPQHDQCVADEGRVIILDPTLVQRFTMSVGQKTTGTMCVCTILNLLSANGNENSHCMHMWISHLAMWARFSWSDCLFLQPADVTPCSEILVNLRSCWERLHNRHIC